MLVTIANQPFSANHFYTPSPFRAIMSLIGPIHIVDRLIFHQEDKPSDETLKKHLVDVARTQKSAAISPHDLQYHGHVITPVILCIALIVGFIMLA